jgi:hypothetical protein
MKKQKATRTIFIFSISIVVALVVINITFFTIASLIGLFSNSEIVRFVAIFIAIITAAVCGFLCYKKIFMFLDKELKNI